MIYLLLGIGTLFSMNTLASSLSPIQKPKVKYNNATKQICIEKESDDLGMTDMDMYKQVYITIDNNLISMHQMSKDIADRIVKWQRCFPSKEVEALQKYPLPFSITEVVGSTSIDIEKETYNTTKMITTFLSKGQGIMFVPDSPPHLFFPKLEGHGIERVFVALSRDDQTIQIMLYGKNRIKFSSPLQKEGLTYFPAFAVGIDDFQGDRESSYLFGFYHYFFLYAPTWFSRYPFLLGSHPPSKEWVGIDPAHYKRGPASGYQKDWFKVEETEKATIFSIKRSVFHDSPKGYYSLFLMVGLISEKLKWYDISGIYDDPSFLRFTPLSPFIDIYFADEVHCCTIPKELLKGK